MYWTCCRRMHWFCLTSLCHTSIGLCIDSISSRSPDCLSGVDIICQLRYHPLVFAKYLFLTGTLLLPPDRVRGNERMPVLAWNTSPGQHICPFRFFFLPYTFCQRNSFYILRLCSVILFHLEVISDTNVTLFVDFIIAAWKLVEIL